MTDRSAGGRNVAPIALKMRQVEAGWITVFVDVNDEGEPGPDSLEILRVNRNLIDRLDAKGDLLAFVETLARGIMERALGETVDHVLFTGPGAPS